MNFIGITIVAVSFTLFGYGLGKYNRKPDLKMIKNPKQGKGGFAEAEYYFVAELDTEHLDSEVSSDVYYFTEHDLIQAHMRAKRERCEDCC